MPTAEETVETFTTESSIECEIESESESLETTSLIDSESEIESETDNEVISGEEDSGKWGKDLWL